MQRAFLDVNQFGFWLVIERDLISDRTRPQIKPWSDGAR